jgi:hypothetical protein
MKIDALSAQNIPYGKLTGEESKSKKNCDAQPGPIRL